MKLSLAWIFDHIKGTWTDYSIDEIVAKINKTTAEVDSCTLIAVDWNSFFVGVVSEVHGDTVVIIIPELHKKIMVPRAHDYVLGLCFLFKKIGKDFLRATYADLKSYKDGMLPSVMCHESHRDGQWRNNLESHDYIIEIDNKSITNRPDLWGHRGFAREIAAMFNGEMVQEESLIALIPIQHYSTKTDHKASWSCDISQSTVCSRFAAVHITNVTRTCSDIKMLFRLSRLNVRCYNFFVDATNYVLHDFGHPMHAFDARKIAHKKIVVRQALSGESLALLDGTTIELSVNDCIVADDQGPLSLAGIMGGIVSSVSCDTQELFLEAAHFDATALRLSGLHHKKRTDSSMRFEKTLDPNGNTTALLRYIRLLDDHAIVYTIDDAILSLGRLAQEKIITVSHTSIVDRIGVTIVPSAVESILKRLGFGVALGGDHQSLTYTIVVPTYRGTKDISIKEDIIEEVARFFGYDAIVPQLPKRLMAPQDYDAVFLLRNAKNHCAYSLKMREVYNYALYDEQFIKLALLEINNAVMLKNPVSSNWIRMVTSLVPHLLKNVMHNCLNDERLRFFEYNRVWSLSHDCSIREHTALAGIFYDRSGALDFYESKAELQTLFNLLMLHVVWRKCSSAPRPWMDEYRSAELVMMGVDCEIVLGYAGMIADSSMHKVALGNSFVFEINFDHIIHSPQVVHSYVESSKYQSISFDISMFVPYKVTVEELEDSIARVDARIIAVRLIDVFEKEEWADRRSITIHVSVQDHEKTLTTNEIAALQHDVYSAIQKYGVEIR